MSQPMIFLIFFICCFQAAITFRFVETIQAIHKEEKIELNGAVYKCDKVQELDLHLFKKGEY